MKQQQSGQQLSSETPWEQRRRVGWGCRGPGMADPEAGLSLWARRGPDPCTRPAGAVPRLPRVPSPGLPGSLRHKEGGWPSPHPQGRCPSLDKPFPEGLKLGTPGSLGRQTLSLRKGLGPAWQGPEGAPSLGRPGADGLQGPRYTGRADSAVNQQERQVQRSPKPSLGAPRLTGLRTGDPDPHSHSVRAFAPTCTHGESEGNGPHVCKGHTCDTHTQLGTRARTPHMCARTLTHTHTPQSNPATTLSTPREMLCEETRRGRQQPSHGRLAGRLHPLLGGRWRSGVSTVAGWSPGLQTPRLISWASECGPRSPKPACKQGAGRRGLG